MMCTYISDGFSYLHFCALQFLRARYALPGNPVYGMETVYLAPGLGEAPTSINPTGRSGLKQEHEAFWPALVPALGAEEAKQST